MRQDLAGAASSVCLVNCNKSFAVIGTSMKVIFSSLQGKLFVSSCVDSFKLGSRGDRHILLVFMQNSASFLITYAPSVTFGNLHYNVGLNIFLLKYLFEYVCLIAISPFLSPLWMFYTFGSLPPCGAIVLTRTTLVVTFANTVDFSPLCPQYLQEPPEFLSICPPSIIEFPLFNQLGLPNLTRNRSVVCISNWSPFYPPFQPPSLPFLLPLRVSLDF